VKTKTTILALAAAATLFATSPAKADEKAMTFTYTNGHIAEMGMDFRSISATGLFVEGTAAEFRLFVEQNKIKAGAVVGAAWPRPSAWAA
jgi:hypothetical protein